MPYRSVPLQPLRALLAARAPARVPLRRPGASPGGGRGPERPGTQGLLKPRRSCTEGPARTASRARVYRDPIHLRDAVADRLVAIGVDGLVDVVLVGLARCVTQRLLG